VSTLELEHIKHADLASGNNISLTSAGNVGVGAAPVAGDFEVHCASGGELRVDNYGASGVLIKQLNGGSGTSGTMMMQGGTSIILATNDTATALTLDASQNAIFAGNVGVKNTSPQNTLEVGTNNTRNAISLRGGVNGNGVMVEMVDGKTGSFSSVTVDIQYSGAGGYGYQIHSYGTSGSFYQSGGGYTNGTNNFSHNTSQTNGSGWSVSSPSANLVRVTKSTVGTHPGVWVKAYGALSVGLKQSDVTITYA